MDYRELFKKYNNFLGDINRLPEENSQLKAQLGLTKLEIPLNCNLAKKSGKEFRDDDLINSDYSSDVTSTSNSFSKTRLFMPLFNGRDDVYAMHSLKHSRPCPLFRNFPFSWLRWKN